MAKVTVVLLKPLNGAEIGSRAKYDARDVARLEKLGAVRKLTASEAPDSDDGEDGGDAAADAPAEKAKRAPNNKAETAPKNKSQG